MTYNAHCKYCGVSWDRAIADAMMTALGARLSWNPAKCDKAPRVLVRGPRGGTKYERQHVWIEVVK